MGEVRLEIVGVGPQKTATSWLAEMLGPTQNLCFPSGVKETFFWDRSFDRGTDWYFGHFQSDGRRIEIGPTYFHSSDAIARLNAHNPDLKVIVTLRDPSARAWSLYQHHLRKGRVRNSFEEATTTIPEIKDASRYGKHLRRWQKMFGQEQILVLLQEDVQRIPATVLSRVSRFIGEDLETDNVDLGNWVNVAGRPPSRALASLSTRTGEALRRRGLYGVVSAAKKLGLKQLIYGGTGTKAEPLPDNLRAKLAVEFEEDISFVERLLGISLDHWR